MEPLQRVVTLDGEEFAVRASLHVYQRRERASNPIRVELVSKDHRAFECARIDGPDLANCLKRLAHALEAAGKVFP